MHATELGYGILAHHDGAFEGDVILAKGGKDIGVDGFSVPYECLERLVVAKIRASAISRIERMTDEEIIGTVVAGAASRSLA